MEYSLDLPKKESEFYLVSKYKNINTEKETISNSEKYIPNTKVAESDGVFKKLYKKWFK